jgi:hypothetical protein
MKSSTHHHTLHLSFKIKCCVDRLRPPQQSGHDDRSAATAACEAAGIALTTSLVDFPGSQAAYREGVAQAARDGANTIMVGDNPDTLENRVLIVNLIEAAKIPTIYPLPEFVDAGGLIAYSFDLVELNKRAANDIAAILRGANPGDIPYYQASKFELSINLKTAKSLGLTVPSTLLASADEVIEQGGRCRSAECPLMAHLRRLALPTLRSLRAGRHSACTVRFGRPLKGSAFPEAEWRFLREIRPPLRHR